MITIRDMIRDFGNEFFAYDLYYQAKGYKFVFYCIKKTPLRKFYKYFSETDSKTKVPPIKRILKYYAQRIRKLNKIVEQMNNLREGDEKLFKKLLIDEKEMISNV